MKLLAGAAVALSFTLVGATHASAQDECVPAEVDATEFFVDGELDLEAYAAAVAAANAACSEGEALPATGSNSSDVVPIGVGLTVLGAAALATAAHRRRSLEPR